MAHIISHQPPSHTTYITSDHTAPTHARSKICRERRPKTYCGPTIGLVSFLCHRSTHGVGSPALYNYEKVKQRPNLLCVQTMFRHATQLTIISYMHVQPIRGLPGGCPAGCPGVDHIVYSQTPSHIPNVIPPNHIPYTPSYNDEPYPISHIILPTLSRIPPELRSNYVPYTTSYFLTTYPKCQTHNV